MHFAFPSVPEGTQPVQGVILLHGAPWGIARHGLLPEQIDELKLDRGRQAYRDAFDAGRGWPDVPRFAVNVDPKTLRRCTGHSTDFAALLAVASCLNRGGGASALALKHDEVIWATGAINYSGKPIQLVASLDKPTLR